MRAFTAIFLILFFWLGCAYTPDCNLPGSNELANPSDLIEYNGNLLIVNTDSSARFCNGFVTLMSIESGEVIKRYDIGNRDVSFLGKGALLQRDGNDYLILTERGADTLIAYDLNKEEIAWRVPAGDDPLDIAVDDTRDLALVTDLREDAVSLFRVYPPSEAGEIARISLPGGLNGFRPSAIVLSTDRSTAYISGRFYPRIYKIDMNTLALRSDYINLETSVSGLDTREIYTHDNTLFVLMRSPPSVALINLTTDSFINFIPVRNKPYGFALYQEQGLIFVTDYQDNILLKIDINTGRILNETGLGDGPTEMLLTSDRRYLFVANFRGSRISRIELDTWEVKEFP